MWLPPVLEKDGASKIMFVCITNIDSMAWYSMV